MACISGSHRGACGRLPGERGGGRRGGAGGGLRAPAGGCARAEQAAGRGPEAGADAARQCARAPLGSPRPGCGPRCWCLDWLPVAGTQRWRPACAVRVTEYSPPRADPAGACMPDLQAPAACMADWGQPAVQFAGARHGRAATGSTVPGPSSGLSPRPQLERERSACSCAAAAAGRGLPHVPRWRSSAPGPPWPPLPPLLTRAACLGAGQGGRQGAPLVHRARPQSGRMPAPGQDRPRADDGAAPPGPHPGGAPRPAACKPRAAAVLLCIPCALTATRLRACPKVCNRAAPHGCVCVYACVPRRRYG